MIYAVSLDPLARMGVPLPALIADFAETGFGGISIDPRALLTSTVSTRRDIVAAVAESGLAVALHGSFDAPVEKLAELAHELAPHLRSITFDPVLTWTSAGLLFSAGQMSHYLQELDRRTLDHQFRYGVEDFPETPFCLQMYRDNLSPLLASQRFGILIDIGHFNESVHRYGYYNGVSPEEHFAQLPVPLLEVHLSDNNGKEDQHLPLAMGIVDFRSVARGLRKLRFDGLSTIEIKPTGEHEDAIASAREQIASSHAFWRQVVDDASREGAPNKPDAGDA